MLFRVFLLHLATLLVAVPALAQLSDLYTNFSKITYEAVHGCPKLQKEDFAKPAACTPGNSADNVSAIAQINEEMFFAGEAQEELQNLGCAIRTTQTVKKNISALKTIATDTADKAILAAPIYSELQKAKLELSRLRSQGNNRARATNRNTSHQRMAGIANRVSQLEHAWSAISASVWQGNSQTMSKLFIEKVQMASTDKNVLAEELLSDLPVTLLKLRSEFEDNRRKLVEQKSSNSTWDLSLASKKMLFYKAQAKNSFQTKFPDSPNLSQGMECRLEGKYGKGQEYADNVLFVGTLAASGGAALLTRGGLALRATVARGVNLGKISEHAGQLMLKSAIGLNTAMAINEIEKNCLSKRTDFVTQKNMCPDDDVQLVGGEIQNLEQGNCVLAVVLSGAPLPVIAAAGKALAEMKAPGLLSSFVQKGEDFLNRSGSTANLSSQNISKYTQESTSYLKSLGMKTEKVTSDTLPNYDKIRKSERLHLLRKQLATQEHSFSVIEEKSGSDSLQGALFGNMPKSVTGEEGAMHSLIDKVKPLSREENLKHIKNEIATLENEISTAPDTLTSKTINVLEGEQFNVRAQSVPDDYSLLKIVTLPSVKGPAKYDTPAILHPEMQKDIDELKRLGVDVRIDPALKAFDDRGAFYFGSQIPSTSRVINIGATTPYEVFKHEKTHALFHQYIKPKLTDLNKAAKEGKSIDSVLTAEEMQGFGKSNLKSLEKNLKKDNTELALNERIAVDAQLKEMGLMRYTPGAVDTEAYGLRHQLQGYQQILEKNKTLTSKQEIEYLKIVAKAGALVSYQEGAQEAQRVIKAFATPSVQGAQALARKLTTAPDDKEISKQTYFFDQAGRLLVLKADGTWQRFNAK